MVHKYRISTNFLVINTTLLCEFRNCNKYTTPSFVDSVSSINCSVIWRHKFIIKYFVVKPSFCDTKNVNWFTDCTWSSLFTMLRAFHKSREGGPGASHDCEWEGERGCEGIAVDRVATADSSIYRGICVLRTEINWIYSRECRSC